MYNAFLSLLTLWICVLCKVMLYNVIVRTESMEYPLKSNVMLYYRILYYMYMYEYYKHLYVINGY
jgi:hypothetical protein